MKFGENLKKLRKLKRISQEELAEKVNVSRQSVSKWETGDAYPEMNNILEICRVFNCHINELVNDSIIDVASFDDDVRENVVKFKRDQQRKMKGLSKTISIISKICNLFVTISIPIVAITMLILGVLINKVDIVDNEIRFKNINDKIVFLEENDKVIIKVNDKEINDISDQENILKLKEIMESNSKYVLIWYVEAGFLCLIMVLVLIRIMLKSLSSLFDNIHKGDTPFTLENVNYIKRMAYLMIAITLMPSFIGVLFEMALDADLNVGFELFSLIEVLFLFSIAYIFQYGYEIQFDSKGIMYGNTDE